MFGRLLLIPLQLGVAWFATPMLMARFWSVGLPNFGRLEIFAYAFIAAAVVWLVGSIAGALFEDLAGASVVKLAATVLAAFFGAFLSQSPEVGRAVAGVIPHVPAVAYPLLAAALGYALVN